MTLGSHQKTIGDSQKWITPLEIINALGPFDLDPCAANPRPWDCAKVNYCEPMDGLAALWVGRVWLNPPFDRRVVGQWVRKLAYYGAGTALVHARTEAEWFEPVWQEAKGILFLADRLYFHYPDGTRAEANSGAPACLCAFSDYDAVRLRGSKLKGYLVTDWENQ